MRKEPHEEISTQSDLTFDSSMLYNGSDVIRDVEWVIFDEVHYVNDAEVSNCLVSSVKAIHQATWKVLVM